MTSLHPKAGAAPLATIEPDSDQFDAAVQRRMTEIGMSERKARFVTAIEFGLLPDGDVELVTEAGQPYPRTTDH